MIEAVIFDMDGLLIDSEPLWQQAEIAIFKQVEIILIPSMCVQTKGLRIDEVVEYWYKKYPWNNLSKLQVEEAIVNKLIELICTEGKALAGVEDAINYVKTKDVKIALASSSSSKIINAALEKLNIADNFEIIYSAESELLGKPHPGVYLTTAEKLGVSPQNCLALEDSLNGVLAAKAAQMKCIAIPEMSEHHNPKFAIADVVLESLQQLDDNIWDLVNL
ncbi:MAG: hexitol phosphatase HxpB [Richelia sp. RM2_1_2]|nr:hexitol phosphatase HxpB [Richelia sp. SM2_1_7]NJM24039.1 hexitol phosphatase HxpB [Richelia sp. SM1_7_0]NJN12231.1 hexitol phosphatase HxpB [Richelia sp. RM1_1_1]NJO31709.1 hexitol phosphatase HxpB [Richelia sp. SL_2_1]NJO64147.1 hexitol phosphatase HxpB [Richelia sp. RM2_1_2]